MWQHIFVLSLLFKSTSPRVTGFGDTSVEYGKDAHYKCELWNQKGVHQITWQKRLRDNSVENVASYSKRFGQHVNEPYQGKVILTETSLSSASLTLKNVTWGDEFCYICIFNVYPEESKRKQTCLTVEGISEVKAEVYHPSSGLADGTASVGFSCSATGKPAPTIRWGFSPNVTGLQHPVTTLLVNDDGTFTSSQNVTLRMSGRWEGHADCVVQSGSWPERLERLPFSWTASLEEEEEEAGETGGRLSETGQILLVLAILVLMAIIVLTIVIRLKRTQKRQKVFRDGVFFALVRAMLSLRGGTDLNTPDVPRSQRDQLQSPTSDAL
ncbi:uncharacterized protein LOC133504832 [Syngnathoides biaculeatus]|uniref:uncharacterized protein LOC133504832 n=1 Tax=Syngnathoides biaculeatus TaxID=300417 RepID=UPI002ADD99DF|nr:uncharacterized protein LOC133504832 [Syngnathoides biaculeatus]